MFQPAHPVVCFERATDADAANGSSVPTGGRGSERIPLARPCLIRRRLLSPIQLAGRLGTVDKATGVTLSTTSTEHMPDGVIYKNCGNRRSSVCPSCSTTYRRDAYQVIRTGLTGGKGVPATIAGHPAVFATFTAPGFGPVHTRRTSKSGQQLPCRPRREEELCPHGVDMRCDRIHATDEKALGLPLCLDCYDHAHQVVFNHTAGELWRRTRIGLDRTMRRIAKARGVDPDRIRLSYGKVAEMQRRGVVHFHAIIRLDGVDPDDREAFVQVPEAIGLLDLVDAIERAVRETSFTAPAHHLHPSGWTITWGGQLDIRPVRVSGNRDITDEMVAGYLSKYATKSTEAAGHISRRLDRETVDLYADPNGSLAERLVHACWSLGGYVPGIRLSDQKSRPYGGLRRWAHMLGFGGHFLTKSRHYSITFRILRDNRVVYQRGVESDLTDEHQEQATVVVATLVYAGSGSRNLGDQLLANTSAAMARERRRIGRIGTTSIN